MLAPIAIPQLNAAADSAISQVRGFKQKADTAAEIISPDFSAEVQKGASIAGHTVNSGNGFRDTANLPEGASADHKGVDLATEIGMPIKAIGAKGSKTKVRCWTDPKGGGNVAEMEPEFFPDLKFQSLHSCNCLVARMRFMRPVRRLLAQAIPASVPRTSTGDSVIRRPANISIHKKVI